MVLYFASGVQFQILDDSYFVPLYNFNSRAWAI